MSRPIWRLHGPDDRPERASMADALKRLHYGRLGAPTDADRPPPSTLPVTRAAREALRLSRGL